MAMSVSVVDVNVHTLLYKPVKQVCTGAVLSEIRTHNKLTDKFRLKIICRLYRAGWYRMGMTIYNYSSNR